MKTIKLIALDLDGTLLNMEKKVPQGNYEALKQCEAAGIQIVPATGRGVGGIPPMIRELPGANYAITTNGAVVADLKNNKAIKTCGLSNEMIQRILNIAKKYHSATDPFIDGRAITEPASIDHMDEFGLSPEMQKLIRDTREVVPNVMEYVKTTGAEAEKVNIFMADLEEREVLRKELMAIPELSISSSMYNNLEVNAKGADKGSALLWLADYLGIDREEMIEHVLNGYGSPAYSVCDKMPWYNPDSETSYDPEAAKALLEEAGWTEGKDGIREKDGVQAGFTLLYPASDSVRQALAADTANQLKELGIQVSIEGVGWDTAYDRAQSTPLMWGWGAHTPMEFYNIYHTAQNSSFAEYSPYSNKKVDEYTDQALESQSLEESYDLWKKAQWDGENGVTQDGDIPWIWLVNIDHLYWSRKGLHVADQKLHPHGHGWSIVNNVDQWTWE